MKRSRRPVAPLLLAEVDLATLTDPAVRRLVQQVLNVVEQLAQTVADLRAENQALRDENARLKGEQGKPAIRPAASAAPQDYSSEAERRVPTPRTPRSTRTGRPVDRTETLLVDRATLPADARFKGYQRTLVQELVLRQETIVFRRAKWYAASTGTTYLAPLPAGYTGQFGPELKRFALGLYWQSNVSEAGLPRVPRAAAGGDDDLVTARFRGLGIDELAGLHDTRRLHQIGFAGDVLHHDDRVGAAGQQRAGHDLDGLAGV